jgi:hypothetical protein
MLQTGTLMAFAIGFMAVPVLAGNEPNAQTGQAEEQVLNFNFAADYYNKYIWRGQNLNNESVFQPAISASAYGFTGSIWANLDLTNGSQSAPDNAWEFSEFDYALDYSGTMPGIDWLGFSAGAVYYRLPNTSLDSTTEIYGGLSLNNVLLSPSFKWYRDIDDIKGSYFQLGIGQTFEKVYVVNEKYCCGLQLGASVGWGSSNYNEGYFGIEGGKFNDLTLSTALCMQIDSWMVKPNINYSTMLSEDIRQATDNSENLWFGVGISTSF